MIKPRFVPAEEATVVFNQILGIPAHPLIIHAAVVFVPLQIVAAIVYGLVPAWRRSLWWAVLGLAIVAPAAAWAAKLSGEQFEKRLISEGRASGALLTSINNHASFAAVTAYLTLGLSLGMLVLLWSATRTQALAPVEGQTAEITADAAKIMGGASGLKILSLAMTIAVIVLGAFTGYYIFKTGDTGAHIVWTGF
jgi:hypothetical protein